MSVKRTSRNGVEGYFIDVTVHVKNPALCNDKKQLRRNRFLSLRECPTKVKALETEIEWLKELQQRALFGDNAQDDDVTFKECIQVYMNNKPYHQTLKHLSEEIGHFPVNEEFAPKYFDWIKTQLGRNKMIWKNVKGKKKLSDIKKPITEETIKSYKRYSKAVLNHCANPEIRFIDRNPLQGMKIGRSDARWRPILPDEEKRILEITGNEYPWFLPVLQMMMCNPIRPGDLFNLRQSAHFNKEKMTLKYLPSKTEGKTNRVIYGHPIIFDSLLPFFQNLHDPEECDYIYARPGQKRLGEVPTKKYKINYYDGYWFRICKLAGVKDIRIYDWKHHSVFYLRSKGFYDWAILRIGGWATRDILEVYDTHDSDAFQDWAKEKLRENPNGNQMQKSVMQLLMNANGMNEQERWDYIQQCAKDNIDPAKVRAILEILNAPSVTAPQTPQVAQPVLLQA